MKNEQIFKLTITKLVNTIYEKIYPIGSHTAFFQL